MCLKILSDDIVGQIWETMPLSLIVPSPFYSVVADIDAAATSERDELCLDLAGNLIDKERGLSCISRRWQRVCFFFFTVSPHQHAWPPCFAPEEEAHCQAREEGIRGFDAKILLIKAKLLQKWNDDENISLLSTRALDRASIVTRRMLRMILLPKFNYWSVAQRCVFP